MCSFHCTSSSLVLVTSKNCCMCTYGTDAQAHAFIARMWHSDPTQRPLFPEIIDQIDVVIEQIDTVLVPT